MPRRRRYGTRRAQIHLPPMSPEEALLCADVFERGIHALWRAHGDAMADYLGCVDPERMLAWQSPDDVVTSKPDPDDGCVDPERMLAWQSPDDVVTSKPDPDDPDPDF